MLRGVFAKPRNQSLLHWVFARSVVVCSAALDLQFLFYYLHELRFHELAVLGKFHLSKHWENLALFKS